ncbi:MAG: hypothetical protein HYS13_26255 [Planctomycetia bacterium]|nr:hypothetical protein [Planctomycetia bacterium]
MFRTIVTAYLIAVAGAGPGLCCCTIVRLFAAGDCHSAAAGDAHRHACCHHRDLSNSSPDAHQSPSRPARDDKSPRCPCQDHWAVPVAFVEREVRVGSPTEAAQGEFPSLAGLSLDVGPAHADGSGGSSPGHAPPPFRTGTETLRALCVLRC